MMINKTLIIYFYLICVFEFTQERHTTMEGVRAPGADDDHTVALALPAANAAEDENAVRELLRRGPSAAANITDARKRLMRDLKVMEQSSPEGVSAHPVEDDLMHWRAVIFGPEDSIWEGGIFKLDMVFTAEYPMSPPKVKFLTPVFHPNVYSDGQICMDIMKSQWSPVYDVVALLLSIQSLLSDPNPNSAANGGAAEMYAHSRLEYEAKVRDIVEKSLELAAEDDE